MTDTQEFKNWLDENNNSVTLGDIMQTHFACEYRKHFTLLRKQGLNFECIRNSQEPSKNLYQLKVKVDSNGQ